MEVAVVVDMTVAVATGWCRRRAEAGWLARVVVGLASRLHPAGPLAAAPYATAGTTTTTTTRHDFTRHHDTHSPLFSSSDTSDILSWCAS